MDRSFKTGRVGRNDMFPSNETFESERDRALDNLGSKNFQFYAVLMIALVGLPANVLCINIMRKNFRKQKNVYKVIFSVIVIATVSLMLYLLAASKNVAGDLLVSNGGARYVLSYLHQYLRNVIDKSLSALVFILSLSRLLAVAKPLHLKNMCFIRHLGKITIISIIAILLITIPLSFDSFPNPSKKGGKTRESAIQVYISIVTVTFNIGLCSLQIIVNIALSIFYANYFKTRQTLTTTQLNGDAQGFYTKITIMLSTVYLLNALPKTIMEILVLVLGDSTRGGKYSKVFSNIVYISFVMNALSAAVYGPIFLMTSRDKRSLFWNVLTCRKCRGKKDGNTRLSMSAGSEGNGKMVA